MYILKVFMNIHFQLYLYFIENKSFYDRIVLLYYHIMKQRIQYFLYVAFAVLSTLINIGIQKGMEILFSKAVIWELYIKKVFETSNITYGLLIQMATATVIAFIFKYIVFI